MNRLTRWLPSRRWLFIPPILIGLIVLAVFVRSRKELPTKTQEKLDLENQVSLPVLTIKTQTVQPKATGFGTVQPSRTWTAIAEVSGRIVETHPGLDSGVPVAAGELLVRIDESDYELTVNQRQAELDSAIATRQELEASLAADQASLAIESDLLEVSQAELDRQRQLQQRRATSTSELDQARGNLLRQTQAVQKLKNSISLYPSRIAAAEASAELAKSRLKVARRDLARTKIVSPFDGVLANVTLEVEQVVGKNERLFQVQDARQMETNAQFSLSQLDKIAPSIGTLLAESGSSSNPDLLEGLSAELVVRSGNFTRRWTGKPIRIADSIDPVTRTLGIVIQVDNQTDRLPRRSSQDASAQEQVPANAKIGDATAPPLPANRSLSTPLRAGTFCEVSLLGPPISNTIAVPRTALDGDSVYVVKLGEDNQYRLQKKVVTIGATIDEWVVIEAGLVPGDRIAVKPPELALDNLRIQPVEDNPAPGARVSDAAWKDR